MNQIANKRSRLQFITNQWSRRSIAEQVERACQGGCRWIQLRLKDMEERKWLETISQVKPICHHYGAFLIINDHVEMALRGDADGVHLGKEDMSPEKARQILGDNRMIGATANTLEDIRRLDEKLVDYIGLGPYRFTTTKKALAPVLGAEGYRQIIHGMKQEKITLPVIAVGGIGLEDIGGLIQTGIHGIAVSSAISEHPHPETLINQVINQINTEVQDVENMG